MELIDITVPIRSGMVTYPGDPAVIVERVASLAAGDVANVSRVEMGLHTGTHVDAPVHFIDGGAGIDELALGALIGPCEVVALPTLDGESVASAVHGAVRVLFRTSNSELWERDSFAEDFLSLDADAARALVEREGLDLRRVEPGAYELICLPLKVAGSDGAPARAVLVRR